jgi:peroxiredoxin Q/BCP
MGKVAVGDKVPAFKVKDHKGFQLTHEDLIGTPTVIFFYPKDNTPGCTKEVCDFQSQLKKFSSLDVLILGVSPDSIESHQEFIKKFHINYTLLSDPDRQMCHSFGAIHEGKVERSTFAIDVDGVIRWIEKPAKVEGHVERVIEAVEKNCPSVLQFPKALQDDYIEFLKNLKNKPK